MKIIKVGDVQRAACNHCKSFESVTFKLCNVPFSDGSGVVKSVLAGVCDKCSLVAVIPHQSTPAIKKQLDTQRKSIESRVPAHMIDILSLASYELSGSTDFMPSICKYYIHALATNVISPVRIASLSKSSLFKGESQKRISIKGRSVADELMVIKCATNIPKTSDLLKSIILLINDDLLVNKNAVSIDRLKNIVAATI